jgi:hypothetical protein
MLYRIIFDSFLKEAEKNVGLGLPLTYNWSEVKPITEIRTLPFNGLMVLSMQIKIEMHCAVVSLLSYLHNYFNDSTSYIYN